MSDCLECAMLSSNAIYARRGQRTCLVCRGIPPRKLLPDKVQTAPGRERLAAVASERVNKGYPKPGWSAAR